MNASPARPDAATLLRDPSLAGLHSCTEDGASALFQAGPAEGFNAYRIDLGLARDARSLHHVMARALHFPEWYGNNWDALLDCLADMSWNEADGYLILMQRAEVLARAEPKIFTTFLDVLRETALFWREEGRPFWVLFIGEFEELSPLEVSV